MVGEGAEHGLDRRRLAEDVAGEEAEERVSHLAPLGDDDDRAFLVARHLPGPAAGERQIGIGDAVAEAWIALKTARDVEVIIRESQLPQAEIGFQSSASGYELGRIDFVDVLMAEQQLWTANISLIGVLFDQQKQLATLEKLIGEEL
mgnify:CR=1 FL=1